MSSIAPQTATPVVEYPECDGIPMSDNTKQFRWITTIQGGLDAMYLNNPNVFVAGDLLWYPVEGDNKTRAAPDVFIAIGRPKGDRGSYLQWKEGGVAPQVVFEVLSPGNRKGNLKRRFRFFERFGVEEYYSFDPDRLVLVGWLRDGDTLKKIPEMNGWVSPRLQVSFELADDDLVMRRPDGRKFSTYVELDEKTGELLEERKEWIEERVEWIEEKQEWIEERDTMLERQQALEREKRENQQRAERLAAQLRALGIQPDE